MTFSEALELMKQGKMVRRLKWKNAAHEKHYIFLDPSKRHIIMTSGWSDYKAFTLCANDIFTEDWEEYNEL